MDAFYDALRAMNSIRKWREVRGLSQGQLADKIGVTQAALSRWETGERYPGKTNLRALADALDVRPADLIDDIVDVDLRPELVEVEVVLASTLRKLGYRSFRVLADSVCLSGIKVNDVVLVDMEPSRLANVPSGSTVAVEAMSEEGTKVLVLRQFIAPSLITTNRRGTNLAVTLDAAGRGLKIVGVIVEQ